MTLDEARRLYAAGGGDWDDYDERDREDIRDQLSRVVAAPTLEEAAKVIEWWNGLDEAMRFAGAVRAAAGLPAPLSEVERLTVERDAALAEVARLQQLVELMGEEQD